MAKNRLATEDYFDFHLVGLVYTVKEYKLVWHLNDVLGFHLEKQKDVSIEFQRNSRIAFSTFKEKTEHKEVHLIKNRLVARSNSSFQYLLEELKQFDYLLKYRDDTDQTDMKNFLSLTKSIPVVDYAANLEPALIKSRDNLIF